MSTTIEAHRLAVFHGIAVEAESGDVIMVAGLAYAVVKVSRVSGMRIEAMRTDDTGSLSINLHAEAAYEALRWSS